MEDSHFATLITAFQYCYGFICVIGVAGNGVVLIVIGSTKQLHTTSNFYISSMAASDLLFLLICAPLNIYQLHAFQCWQLGPVACSLTFYMMNVSVLISCFSLVLLSIDRCIALKYPLESIHYRQPSTAVFAITSCWILALLIPIYKIFSAWPKEGKDCYCMNHWDATTQFLLYLMILCISYLLPLVIIVACYVAIYRALRTTVPLQAHRGSVSNPNNAVRDRQGRITSMIASMAIFFAVIWAPVHLFTLSVRYEKMMDSEARASDWRIVAALLSRALILLGSAVNPIIYSFAGQNFRNHFVETMQNLRRNVVKLWGDGQRRMRGMRTTLTTNFTFTRNQSVVKITNGGGEAESPPDQIISSSV